MKAELRGIDVTDTDVVAAHLNNPDAPYSASATLFFGPRGSKGKEAFYVHVCNSAWIKDVAQREPLFVLNNRILMEEYSESVLESYLVKLTERLEAPDWNTLAAMLGTMFRWEFSEI
jgi:Immunity protein 8